LDVYQVTLICAECRCESKAILSNAVSEALCGACGAKVLKARRFAGVVYVMSHRKVSGVKIGMTRHDVFRRAKQISGTGVPGHFTVMAAFPSSNPMKDERKVHERLVRAHLAKEHFELDPVVAVAKVRSILNREPAFLDRDIEPAVSQLRQEQRQKALGRFAGPDATGVAKPPSPVSQEDLFSRMEPKEIADHASRTPSHSARFISVLFSS